MGKPAKLIQLKQVTIQYLSIINITVGLIVELILDEGGKNNVRVTLPYNSPALFSAHVTIIKTSDGES